MGVAEHGAGLMQRRACLLRCLREAKRVAQWIQMTAIRIIERADIALAAHEAA